MLDFSPMLPMTNLAGLYAPVADPLSEARELAMQLWSETFRVANVKFDSSLTPGGKFLRPALCLLSAGALGAADLRRFVPLATAMEVMHLAALAHDDVIDNADLRRGASSLKAMWSNHGAVLGGDYLVARATDLVGTYGSCALLLDVISALREMAEGELMLLGRESRECGQEDCLRVAEYKTASLFAVACASPGHIFPGGPMDALHHYGRKIGIAFQLADDLLDLTQDENVLGKPSCGDVAEDKATLPLLFMREALDAAGRARLDALRGTELAAQDRAWISQSVDSTGARDRTEATARQYIFEAQNAIGVLEPSIYRDSLIGLAEFMLTRSS